MSNVTLSSSAKVGTIYKITNKLSGKIYVGQTTQNVKRRWQCHCNPFSSTITPIKSAILKYGSDSFLFEVLETCNVSDLNRLEEYYIKQLNSLSPNGYNLKTGGHNVVYTEEARKKMSEARKRYFERVGVLTAQDKRDICTRRRRSKGIQTREGTWKNNEERREKARLQMIGNKLANKAMLSEIKSVKVIRSDGVIFNSVTEAAIAVGCNKSSISGVLDGKQRNRHRCKGFYWKTYKVGVV